MRGCVYSFERLSSDTEARHASFARRYEVSPVSKLELSKMDPKLTKLDPNTVADAVLEEVTSGIEFTPKPRAEVGIFC